MSAIVVASVEVKDPQGYQEYVRANTGLVQQHGGRFVARGGRFVQLEGDWTAERIVLIEFPSVEAAQGWYNSPEYQAIRPIRLRTGVSHLLGIVETVS